MHHWEVDIHNSWDIGAYEAIVKPVNNGNDMTKNTRHKGTRNARVLEVVLGIYGDDHSMGSMVGDIIEVYPSPELDSEHFPWVSNGDGPKGTWGWREDWLEIL